MRFISRAISLETTAYPWIARTCSASCSSVSAAASIAVWPVFRIRYASAAGGHNPRSKDRLGSSKCSPLKPFDFTLPSKRSFAGAVGFASTNGDRDCIDGGLWIGGDPANRELQQRLLQEVDSVRPR